MHTQKLEAQPANVTTSCVILKAKFERDATKAQADLNLLRAKYEMGEARIKALVFKHHVQLNQKVEETLARGWNEWSVQATELQVFRANVENRRKEGRGFYKMDENNIQILYKDLTEEFHALAKTQTTSIRHLLEEFNDDQMLLRPNGKPIRERILAETEVAAAAQASTTNVIEEEKPRLRVETEQVDA